MIPASNDRGRQDPAPSHGSGQPLPWLPRHNALKHGFYSEATLLPGEDVQEYARQRLALFLTYRPQTVDEAEAVETLAECRWQLRRWRPVQSQFDAQLMEPAADAAGRLSEPVGHQRLHSSMDVTMQRQRIDRMGCRARSKLFEMQKLRRLGLVEGALKLPVNCYLDSSGAVIGPVIGPAPAPAVGMQRSDVSASRRQPEVEVRAGDVALGTSGSGDGEIGKSGERQETPVGPPLRGASGERTAPWRGDAQGRLIGGFGARRIFADAPGRASTAEHLTTLPLTSPVPLPSVVDSAETP